MKRLLLSFFLCGAILTPLYAHPKPKLSDEPTTGNATKGIEENAAEMKFVFGEKIRFKLGPGDITIIGSEQKRIRVTYRCHSEGDAKEVRIAMKASESEAVVEVHGPKNNCRNSFHATIEVPSLSHLYGRMLAGNLEVKGVKGDKDFELHAGNLDIEVGSPDDYGPVDASVLFGGLDAPAFHVDKGGIARSFKHHGPGQYRLHAHTGAGEVSLR